jgi:hypothetical protein
MPGQSSNNLLPSEDEIHQILAQTLKNNPSQYPAVMLKIEFARLMLKCFGKLQDQFNESIEQLEDSIDNK